MVERVARRRRLSLAAEGRGGLVRGLELGLRIGSET